MRAPAAAVSILSLLVLGACGSDSDDDGPMEPAMGDLVVQARSAASFPALLAAASVDGPQAAPGDVTRYDVTFY